MSKKDLKISTRKLTSLSTENNRLKIFYNGRHMWILLLNYKTIQGRCNVAPNYIQSRLKVMSLSGVLSFLCCL